MIKVYLDWNVISNLKKTENRELRLFVNRSSNRVLYPFSEAHFHDLWRSMKGDTKSQRLFTFDLSNLNSLCRDSLIEFDVNEGHLQLSKCTPEKFHEEFYMKDYSLSSLSELSQLIQILNSFGEESNLGELFYQLLQSQDKQVDDNLFIEPIGTLSNANVKYESDSNLNDERYDIKEQYQNFKHKFKCEDKEFVESISRALPEKVFSLIQGKINASDKAKDFFDLLIESQKGEGAFYYSFICAYVLLDIAGYHQDNGSDLKNVMTDALHAYYASRFELFVTDDKKLKFKLEPIYRKLGVRTKVISSKDMQKEIQSRLDIGIRVNNYINELDNIIRDTGVSSEDVAYSKLFDIPLFDTFSIGTIIYAGKASRAFYHFEPYVTKTNGSLFYLEVENLIQIYNIAYVPWSKNISMDEFISKDEYNLLAWAAQRELIVLLRNKPGASSFSMVLLESFTSNEWTDVEMTEFIERVFSNSLKNDFKSLKF